MFLLYVIGLLSNKIPTEISFYQAFLGGYFLILGGLLAVDWNKYPVMVAAWFWAFISEIIIFIMTYRWEMIENSNDRYILASSLGSVLFMAGIFYFIFEAIKNIRYTSFKIFVFLLFALALFVITIHNYNLLNRYFYRSYNSKGSSAYWQDFMYKKFVEKFGKENLRKQAFIYIDINSTDGINDYSFYYGSLGNPLPFRIYYDEKGNIQRDNCKAVILNFEIIKKAYAKKDGKKGFLYETGCIAPLSDITGITGKQIFYPLSNFYAYKVENKQLVDIKEETILKLDQIITSK